MESVVESVVKSVVESVEKSVVKSVVESVEKERPKAVVKATVLSMQAEAKAANRQRKAEQQTLFAKAVVHLGKDRERQMHLAVQVVQAWRDPWSAIFGVSSLCPITIFVYRISTDSSLSRVSTVDLLALRHT